MNDENTRLSVKFTWDRDSTAYFISRLLTQVNKKRIDFSLNVKKGSIITSFLIGYVGSLVYDTHKKAIKYLIIELLETTRKRAAIKGKELSKPQVKIGEEKINYNEITKEVINTIPKKIKEESTKTILKKTKSIINDDSFIGIGTPEIIKKYIEKANKEKLQNLLKNIGNELNKRK